MTLRRGLIIVTLLLVLSTLTACQIRLVPPPQMSSPSSDATPSTSDLVAAPPQSTTPSAPAPSPDPVSNVKTDQTAGVDTVGAVETAAQTGKTNPIDDADKTVKATNSNRIVKTAVYLGLVDNHTIEVSIEGQPMAMQLPDEVQPAFEALKLQKDDKVTVTYFQNSHKQMVIDEIKKVR